MGSHGCLFHLTYPDTGEKHETGLLMHVVGEHGAFSNGQEREEWRKGGFVSSGMGERGIAVSLGFVVADREEVRSEMG